MLAVALCLALAGTGHADTPPAQEAKKPDNIQGLKRLSAFPFKPGVKIFYVIRWSIFEVGTATMEFVGPIQYEGHEAWKIVLTAQTNSFADQIFKVRDYNAVWVDKEFTKPLYYVKTQNEGSTHREVEVKFDWVANKAHYSDKGVAREPIDIQPGSWDPLAITYAVRALDFNGLTHISIPSTDGKKSTNTEVNVEPSDSIKSPAGRFDTIPVSPDTKDLGGVFKKSPGAGIRIWFSDDDRHIPVRMASQVIVGSFVAEMERIEGPGADAYNNKAGGNGTHRGSRKSGASKSGSSSSTVAATEVGTKPDKQ
jgi:hypothetical protein